MRRILDVARGAGLAVVEDAAEALCSRHEGRALGTWGVAGCFSFSPNKTITSGQGGMIVTDDAALALRLRALRDQGRTSQGTGGDDHHPMLGFNFKLTNVHAAIALAQLEKLDARLTRQKRIYAAYVEGLRGVGGIEVLPFDLAAGACPQWTDVLCDRRDELEAHLRARGAACRKLWLPIHTQPPYARPDDEFPNAVAACARAMWLPSAFTLSDDDVAYVVAAIRAFYGAGAGAEAS
jgi:perosamine synthetase